MFCEQNIDLSQQVKYLLKVVKYMTTSNYYFCRFVEALNIFLHSTDEGIINHVTSLITNQQNTSDSAAKLLMSLIQNQIQEGFVGKLSWFDFILFWFVERQIENQSQMVSYWFRLIIGIDDWFKSEHLQSLIDHLLMTASLIGDKATLDLK